MSAIGDAAQLIHDAAATVAGVRAYLDPTAVVDPPAVVVGAPTLAWETLDDTPFRATFPVFVITPADDRMLTRLWDLVPAVAAAIGAADAGTVSSAGASPTVYTSGGTDLPAYTISVDVILGG